MVRHHDVAPDKEDGNEGGGGGGGGGGDSGVGAFVSGLRSMETTHQPITILRCKVVVVGDGAVGKTAITQMLNSGGQNYPKSYVMTVSVDFAAKQIPIPNTNTWVELYLFDCAGQSIFNQRNLNSKHWENASFVALVFDVSNRESFNSCGRWLQGVRAMRPSSNGPLPGVLIANKVDLREQERGVVRREEGEEFARLNGLKYFEMAAATGTDVEAPFVHIAQQFHKKYEDTVKQAESSSQRRFG